MQHNITIIIESQIKLLPNGKKKLFIQSSMNGYNIIEKVARDRLEQVDEVHLGMMVNGSENDSEIIQEIWTQSNSENSTSLVTGNNSKENNSRLDNNCSQLFITLRSKVTLIYINILNFIKQEVKKKEKEERKKYQERNKEKKQEKIPPKNGFSEQCGDLDDDFESLPEKSEKYLLSLQKKREVWKDVSKWTANQFGKFMSDEFKKVYGMDSFEFTSFHGQENRRTATGKQWSIIRQNLMTPFHKAGYKNEDIKKYIEWAYSEKSKQLKFPLNLGFLTNKGMITEWMVSTKKNKDFSKKKVEVEDMIFDM